MPGYFNKDELLRIFRSDNSAAKQKFISQLPDSPMKQTAQMMAGLSSPEAGISALDMLASSYCYGIDSELGFQLGKCCYELSIEAYEKYGPGTGNAYLLSAGRCAISCVTALQRLGRSEELIKFADKAIIWLNKVGDTENVRFVQLYRIEAYIELMKYDDAEEHLDKIKDLKFTPAENLHLKRIENKLEEIKRRATELPTTKSFEQELTEKKQQTLSDAINTFKNIFANNGNIFDSLEQRLNETSEQEQSKTEIFNSLSKSADIITDFLSRGESSLKADTLNEFELAKRLRQATGIFMDRDIEKKPSVIKNSLLMLREILAASKNRFPDHENDALWGIYLCFSRLKKDTEAIEALQMLRSNIEKARAKISDPYERAGLMTKFPYMFHELSRRLCRLNRSLELLDAIEGAKGRVLNDILSAREGRPISDQIFSESARNLPAFMQQVNAHYISYFVDDKETYATLVAKDGSIHCCFIPIGKESLNQWLKQINPKTWGKKVSLYSDDRISADLPDKLSPLVEWLDPFFDSGLLEEDDHICYCPDEQMHLFPLHYAFFRGKPLVRYFSVSRIQGALTLINIMKHEKVRPQTFTAFQVPAKQDLKNVDKLNAFDLVPSWLKVKMDGDIFRGENGDIEMLNRLQLQNRLIHFATHGTFPEHDNPYDYSGLMLAHDGQLPDFEYILHKKENPFILSPRKILDMKIDFSGSHVTLHACVSGQAKEGIGGDALGLEWALFQAGAISLLSSHWNVEDWSSAEFGTSFYKYWLERGTSRAVAWRRTVLDIMESNKSLEYPKPYYWAAFSLSGDWR